MNTEKQEVLANTSADLKYRVYYSDRLLWHKEGVVDIELKLDAMFFQPCDAIKHAKNNNSHYRVYQVFENGKCVFSTV